ncbi:hypothetical protein D3C81_1700050 [compost metagenome]
MNRFGIILGEGRVDRTYPQIVGPVGNSLLCLLQGVGGDPDDFVRAQPFTDGTCRCIILSHMYAVRIQGYSQLDIIVYDKRDVVLPAFLLELLCKLNIRLACECGTALFTILE